jgi:hypothetical protein
MAQSVEIKCVNKTNRSSIHEKIENVGGVNLDGSRWKISQENAIAGIKSGKWAFYVTRSGRSVNVIVATSVYGNPYLKTESDTTEVNNLLSLPECP